MTKARTIFALTLGLALALSSASEGARVFSANYDFVPDRNGQRHPANVVQAVVVPVPLADGAHVCALYQRSHPKRNKGKLVMIAKILRADGSEETLRFAGQVNENRLERCKETGPLAIGDTVTMEWRADNMPGVRTNRNRTDFVSFIGAIATESLLGRGGDDGGNDDGGGDTLPPPPPPPPPPPGGSCLLSTSDQESVIFLDNWPSSGRGVALRSEVHGWIIDYRLGGGNNGHLPQFYPTITDAVNAFRRLIRE